MAIDIISLILSRASLAPHNYLSISVPYYICIKYKWTLTPIFGCSLAAFGLRLTVLYTKLMYT